MQNHKVEFVGDEQLPDAVDWAMVNDGPTVTLYVKESRITPAVLTEAWAAYRSLIRVPVALAS